MSRRGRRVELFSVNAWPPFVDALTMVLAAFVLLMLVALVAQKGLVQRLRKADTELAQLREAKLRVERRLNALASTGFIDVVEGKVILQGEILFESGSAELSPGGRDLMGRIGGQLGTLLQSEPGHMVMVGGHTDNRPLMGIGRFPSNWELSSARAHAVARILLSSGLSADRVVAAGFGEHHPRATNSDDEGRRRNRRIEVLLVPIQSVSSK